MNAVLFDVGDTLVHSRVHKRDRFCWLCEQAGLPVPADPLARIRAAQAVERFFQARQSHPHRLTEAWWIEQNEIGLEALGLPPYRAGEVYRVHVELPKRHWIDPEAVPLLTWLRERGYRIGLVSNWDGTLAASCRALGLSHLVDYVGDSAVFGSPKPDPAFFHHVLAALGVAPDHALHVGDSWGADVVGAQAAGVSAVLLDPLDCEERPADFVIRDLRELYETVLQWEQGQEV